MATLAPFQTDLWTDRAVIRAHLGTTRPHRQGVMALMIGLDGPFFIELEGTRAVCRSAVVPAGQTHLLRCDATRMGVVYLFPTSREFWVVSAELSACPTLIDPPWLERLRPVLLDVAAGAAPRLAFDALGATSPTTEGPPLDSRLFLALQYLEERLAEEQTCTPCLADIARASFLSETRLSYLFRSRLGTTPGRYRKFLQLRNLSRLYALGDTLTQAALGAGFADSSHCSHAFSSAFGLPATRVFKGAQVSVHEG